MKMNKKASEKIISIWWFLVLIIIAVAIVAGVSMFYFAEVDARETEAFLIVDRVSSCLIKEGHLNSEVLEADVYEECNLDEGVFAQGNFFFKVYIGGDLQEAEEKVIVGGDESFEKDCEIEKNESVTAEHFPKCFEETFNTLLRFDKVFIDNLRKSFESLEAQGKTKDVEGLGYNDYEFLEDLDVKIGIDESKNEKFHFYNKKLLFKIFTEGDRKGKIYVFVGGLGERWREASSLHNQNIAVRIIGGSNQRGRKVDI